jgi:large subunit ribosomal protein L25
VKLPEGVRPAMDRDFVIANLKASAASPNRNEGDTTTEA